MLIFFTSFFFLSSYDSSSIRQLMNQLHLVRPFNIRICCVYSFFILVFGMICGYIYGVCILVMCIIHLVMLLVCVICVAYNIVSSYPVILFIYVVSIYAYFYLLLGFNFCYFLYFVKSIYGVDLCGFDMRSFCYWHITQRLIYCDL